MKTEWCPKCQAIQNATITQTAEIEKDEKGKEKKIVTKSYQCSVCHMFIRSEVL